MPKPGEQKYQVVRVLIYEGSLNWLTTCLHQRQIKGSFNTVSGSIREAIIGELPQIMEGEFYPAGSDGPFRPPKPMYVLATSTGDPDSPHIIAGPVDAAEDLFKIKAGEGDMIYRIDVNDPTAPAQAVYAMKGEWWDDLSLVTSKEPTEG